jgi:thiol-disulfide isomerase/thioredoxin
MPRAFALSAALWLALAATALARGGELPVGFKLKGLEGGTVKAKDLSGEVVVLQFWASWCQGCADVMVDLHKLLKDDRGVTYLPVSVDETMGEARSYFVHQRPAVRPLRKIAYFDADATLASGLDITALPAVVVVDKKGRIVQRIIGHPSSRQLRDLQALVDK